MPQSSSSWLTLGKVYDVLSVVIEGGEMPMVRLEGDGANGVALFGLDQFEIASTTIPSVWIATLNKKATFELTTELFSTPGFWERYYDGDPDASRIFEKEKTRIIGLMQDA